MLKHIVLLAPKDAEAMDQIHAAMEILATLPAKIDGVVDFHHGPNRDFEGKSQRYPYGFILTFVDKAASEAYAADPDHRRAGAMLVANCDGGADGIFVADLEV